MGNDEFRAKFGHDVARAEASIQRHPECASDASTIQNWPTPSTSNMQNSKPSIGRRAFRAFARYSIVFLIGIGVTLAWQSYSDEAMEMIRTEAPSLAWLLPVSTAKPPPDDQAVCHRSCKLLAELVQRLKLMAFDLAVVRRSVEQLATMVEQLAAKQDQLAAEHCDIAVGRTLTLARSRSNPHLSPGQSPRANPRNPLRSRRPRSHHQCRRRRLLLDNSCADGSAECKPRQRPGVFLLVANDELLDVRFRF